MGKVVFVNRINYGRWILISGAVSLAILALGALPGEMAPLFAVLGGMWLIVLVFVGLIVQFAGGRQIAQLSHQPPAGLVIEANGLFGRGLPRSVGLSETSNWRWLTQGSNSRQIGPKLGMLAFDYAGTTYRMPLTTAKALDLDALRELAPEQMAVLSAKFPMLERLPKP